MLSKFIYKIKNLDTGLYSTGGSSPMWSTIGKVWKQKSHISSHLTLVTESGRGAWWRDKKPYWPYENCVVVSWKIAQEPDEEVKIREFMAKK